jgi:hypothetical protein
VRRRLPAQEVAGEPETPEQAARRESAAERQRTRYDRAQETARKAEYRERQAAKVQVYNKDYYQRHAEALKHAARERKRAKAAGGKRDP